VARGSGQPREGCRPSRDRHLLAGARFETLRRLRPSRMFSPIACDVVLQVPGCSNAPRVSSAARGRARPLAKDAVRNGACAVRIPFGNTRCTGSRFVRTNRGQKDLEGEQSPGRIGHRTAGNGGSMSRTHPRSNASKSTTSANSAQKLGSGNGAKGMCGTRSGRTARGQRPW
jgi:hypothetical protein